MIENNIINIFLIIVIILFLIGIILPMILIKKRGKDPHGIFLLALKLLIKKN